MNFINHSFIVVGVFITLIGIIGFLNPNWTRLINFPGGPRLKAAGATITGLIFLILGLIVNIPME